MESRGSTGWKTQYWAWIQIHFLYQLAMILGKISSAEMGEWEKKRLGSVLSSVL